MRKSAAFLTTTIFLLSVFLGSASQAKSLSADRLKPSKTEDDVYLIDGRYVRGEALLARMRSSGELPDTVQDGKCHFDLAGDTGVAYYVRSCP
jgi:hypothetical protein